MNGISKLWKFFVHTSLYLAIGASSAIVGVIILLGQQLQPVPILIAFFSVLGVYNSNRLVEVSIDIGTHYSRTLIVDKFKRYLSLLVLISFILVAILSLTRSIYLFVAALVPFVVHYFYTTPMKSSLYFKSHRFKRLKEIPLIKDLAVAAVWAFGLVFIPFFYYNLQIEVRLVFLFVFFVLTAVITTMIFDIRDVEGDERTGVKTVPVLYGVEFSKRLMLILNTISGILLFVVSYYYPLEVYFMIPVGLSILYAYFYSLAFGRVFSKDFICETLADGEYILFGVLVLISFYLL